MRYPDEPLGDLTIRSLSPDDAEEQLAFMRHVQGESDHLARSEGDSLSDIECAGDILADAEDDPQTLMLGAFDGDNLVGLASLVPFSRAMPRRRHRAVLSVAVRKARWGNGIARALCGRLLSCAPKMGYRHVGLSVSARNARAIGLYRSLGFHEEGCVKGGLLMEDGTMIDEIWMGTALS